MSNQVAFTLYFLVSKDSFLFFLVLIISPFKENRKRLVLKLSDWSVGKRNGHCFTYQILLYEIKK